MATRRNLKPTNKGVTSVPVWASIVSFDEKEAFKAEAKRLRETILPRHVDIYYKLCDIWENSTNVIGIRSLRVRLFGFTQKQVDDYMTMLSLSTRPSMAKIYTSGYYVGDYGYCKNNSIKIWYFSKGNRYDPSKQV
jgi:hypothetical protein